MTATESSTGSEGRALDRSVPPPPGPAPEFRFPESERSSVDGLEVITVRRPGSPVFYGELVIPAGAENEPKELPGLGTLTVALMDEGTAGRSATQLAEEVEGRGGFLSTSAGWNSAYLAFGGLDVQFDGLLELAADVVASPSFEEREIDRLKAERRAEIARRSADPASIATRGIASVLYGDETYSASLIGSVDSLDRIDRDAILRFYERRVRRRGSTLIVVGDLEHEVVAQRVAERFAAWSGDAPPTRVPPAPAALSGVEVHLYDRPGSAQTELRLAHLGVPRSHPDHTALVVMNSILGGKFTSRLNLNLREERGLTYGVHSRFARRRGRGPFVVQTAVSTDDTGIAAREILREIERLRAEPVPEGELDDARSYVAGVFPYTLQTHEGLAQRLVDRAVHDLPEDYFDRYVAQVREVDSATVLALAQKHLDPSRMAIIAVGPVDALRPQLEPLGPVVVHDSEPL